MTRRELLAVVSAIEHSHYYLYGHMFAIRTDHSALQWLTQFRNPEGQLARWIQKLQTYNFEIAHRPERHIRTQIRFRVALVSVQDASFVIGKNQKK